MATHTRPTPNAAEGLRRRSKYGAQRTECDGIIFHSKAEARRWRELRLLEKAGEIYALERQTSYVLNAIPCGRLGSTLPVPIGVYRCDFRYQDKRKNQVVIEDVKGGPIPPLSKWKIKHFEAQYGIPVQIVRMR